MAGTTSLRAWLQYLRIEKYFDLLSGLGHDALSLAQLSDAELAGLGLPLGPRKKILLNAGLILQSCHGTAGRDVQQPDDRDRVESTPSTAAMHGQEASGLLSPHPRQTISRQPYSGQAQDPPVLPRVSVKDNVSARRHQPEPHRRDDQHHQQQPLQTQPPQHQSRLQPQLSPGMEPLQPPATAVRSDRSSISAATRPRATENLGPKAHGGFPATHAAAATARAAYAGPAAACPSKARPTGSCSHDTSATTFSATAVAERRALAQLYPPAALLRHGSAPQQKKAGPPAATTRAPAERGPSRCDVEGLGGSSPTGPAGAMPGCRLRGVLKRSRSWDGGSAAFGGRPCPGSEGRCSPQASDRAAADGASVGARALSSSTHAARGVHRGCWADGQALYAVAASSVPVDCSFRSLRRCAVAASGAVAVASEPGSREVVRQSPSGLAPFRNGAGAAATAAGSAAAVPRGHESQPGAAARNVVEMTVTQPRPVSGEGGAGTGGNSMCNPSAADDRIAAAPGETRPHAGSAPGVAASLLDDPRNYGTPELLAQLLFDDPAGLAELGDAAAERPSGLQQAGAEGGSGAGAVGRVPAEVTAAEDDRDRLHAGRGEGDGGVRVTREQRLARLRALREEVAATERLLETLRRMVAEEEAALASGLEGGAVAVRSAAAVPAPGAASRQAPPGPAASLPARDLNPRAQPAGRMPQEPPHAFAPQGRPVHTQAQTQAYRAGAGQWTGWADTGADTGADGPGLGPAAHGPPGFGTQPRAGSREVPLEPSFDMDELPTQRWESGMMLAERLELLE